MHYLLGILQIVNQEIIVLHYCYSNQYYHLRAIQFELYCSIELVLFLAISKFFFRLDSEAWLTLVLTESLELWMLDFKAKVLRFSFALVSCQLVINWFIYISFFNFLTVFLLVTCLILNSFETCSIILFRFPSELVLTYIISNFRQYNTCQYKGLQLS